MTPTRGRRPGSGGTFYLQPVGSDGRPSRPVHARAPDHMRHAGPIFAPACYRPGDRRDPATIDVNDDVRALVSEAAERGLNVEQAIPLVLEHALVVADADLLGTSARALCDALDDAARHAQIVLRLGPNAAQYLRVLTTGRAVDSQLGDDEQHLIPLPVRLATRLNAIDITTAIRPGVVEQTIRWEIAALLAGRTMTEWAALTFATQQNTRTPTRHSKRATR